MLKKRGQIKKRLDELLVEKSLAKSRERAKGMIMSGIVLVDGQVVDKAGVRIALDSAIRIKGEDFPYVSRGGLKLEKALDVFKVDIKDKIIVDIGASTGGFTDCLLHRGAKKVYAVDVGYGQLAWKLQQNPQVINMERTNIRYLKPEDLNDKINLCTIDTSFISLEKVFPAVKDLLSEKGEIIALVKPQFEVGKGEVGKGGVVRDSKKHREVLEKIIEFAKRIDLILKSLTNSPILGPKGNVEFLIYLSKDKDEIEVEDIERLIVETVEGKLL